MMLFHRGSPGNTLHIIESGIVRIVSLREREGCGAAGDLYDPGSGAL